MKKKEWMAVSPFLISLLMADGMGAVAFSESPTANLPKTNSVSVTPASAAAKDDDHQQYVDFFEKVYSTMQENYFFPLTRDGFDRFLKMFDAKIYPQLKATGKTVSFVKWRSAAYLVEYLKDKEDIFSAFYPPKAADQYEKEALGKKLDLGIEGELTSDGYLVKRVEPRSDAYEKGLREDDVILKIAQKSIKDLTVEQIQDLLTPLEKTVVPLEYFDHLSKVNKIIEAISKEYFKQTVFMIPVPVPGVYCLAIQHFNQKTSEDMTRFMNYILEQGESSLIIDLRDNPGGPPLAAREISAFFLPPDDEFAYFQKKGQPKAQLNVPNIPAHFHYKGDLVILVNEKSGSASELFSGILQGRGRATLMGTNTAGQVFLKSMFRFDDDSMLLLVTARGFHPDGTVFPFKGLDPNVRVTDPKTDMVTFAGGYLAQRRQQQKSLPVKNTENTTRP